jgi:hypothetical protein
VDVSSQRIEAETRGVGVGMSAALALVYYGRVSRAGTTSRVKKEELGTTSCENCLVADRCLLVGHFGVQQTG